MRKSIALSARRFLPAPLTAKGNALKHCAFSPPLFACAPHRFSFICRFRFSLPKDRRCPPLLPHHFLLYQAGFIYDYAQILLLSLFPSPCAALFSR